MAFLYSDFVTDFRSLMRDSSSQNNQFFTDAEILRWLIDGNTELVREVGLHTFDTTLAVTVFDGDLVTGITADDLDTEIVVDAATCVPPPKGTLIITNSGGDTQSYKYHSWTYSDPDYTFSIDSTEADYTFAVNDTVTIYKGEYPNPTSVIKIMSVLDSEHNRITPITVADLNRADEDWRDKTGDIDYWYPINEKGSTNVVGIGFYKRPTTAETVHIKSWKLPNTSSAAASVASSDSPETEEIVVREILNFALAKGYQKKRDMVMSERYEEKFYKKGIPRVKRFIYKDAANIEHLQSNEKPSCHGIGRMPDGYPLMKF